MRSLDVGSVCMKTTGREAGEKAVVVEVVDDNFVVIGSFEGSHVRKRKCNITHLIPLGTKGDARHHKKAKESAGEHKKTKEAAGESAKKEEAGKKRKAK